MVAKLNFLAIFTFAIITIYFAVAVQTNADTYFHLAIGKRVFEERQIPKFDTFTYGSVDTHYTSTEWLSGLVFYLLVDKLGLQGLVYLRIITGFLALYFLFLTLKLVTENKYLQLSGVLLTGWILALRMNDRPEIFSFVFIAITNYVCIKYYLKKEISRLTYLLPIIYLLWPHIHALVLVGGSLVGFWLTFFVFEKFLFKVKREKLFVLTPILLLSLATAVVQFKRFFYPLIILKPDFFEILEMKTLWQRLFDNKGFDFFYQIPIEIYVYLVILVIYLAVTGSMITKLKSNLKYLILHASYFIFFLTALRFYRLIPVIILVILPVFLFTLNKSKYFLKINPKIFIGLFSVLILVMLISISAKRVFGEKINNFVIVYGDQNNIVDVANRTWKPNFPEKAPKIISQFLNTHHLYTTGGLNDFFIWNLPQIKTFSDIMFEYRTKNDYQEDQIISSGGEMWLELLKKYDIDTVINTQDLPYLLAKTPVYTLSNWKLIYLDDVATIYTREDVIKSTPVDLSAIHPQLPTPLKFKTEDEEKAVNQLKKLLEFENKNAFAREQLIEYYTTKDISEAKKLAEESRNLFPKDPIFAVKLAKIHALSGNCNLAEEFSKEAIRKSFDHILIKDQAQKATVNCQ